MQLCKTHARQNTFIFPHVSLAFVFPIALKRVYLVVLCDVNQPLPFSSSFSMSLGIVVREMKMKIPRFHVEVL
eukprot:m.233665 g.233665  ORF g.233665 m.233665 type:complete len:73 (+) comp13909_c2_seq1:15988-16206(+)